MLAICPKQSVSMLTRDGVRLDADVYYPDAPGDFPVLLMRQPYGRAIASTVVYAHPAWYAAHGYIVVIQDVRGRGTSAGEFDLFAHEVADGFDSVTWAAALPRSTGQVGMYGFSYQGMTQLYAAIAQPPALKTICPSMVGYDLYHDWAYEGGAFCYQLNLGWAIQLAAETARRRGDAEAYQRLYSAGRNLPLADPVCPQSDLLDQLAPDSFYHDWLRHPAPDDYWAALSPCGLMAAVDLPMLHIGGWFDTYLRGTLRLYHDMAGRSRYPQHLIVGPWGHLPWGRKVGAIDYGPSADSPIDQLQVRWFDHFLKGKETGLLEQLPVQLFEMGGDRWRGFERFPERSPQPYWLSSTGLACMGIDQGRLYPADAPRTDDVPNTPGDRLVHDPWRPVPALGGHATAPAGPWDRSALDSRSDVATYTTAPLAADLHLAGAVRATINAIADALSFDISVILSEVRPDGRVFPITQGYLRVADPTQASQPLAIALQPTCARIPQGSAVRVSLSASCAPAYTVNAGTGQGIMGDRLIDAQIITLTVSTDQARPSCILLPVLSADGHTTDSTVC